MIIMILDKHLIRITFSFFSFLFYAFVVYMCEKSGIEENKTYIDKIQLLRRFFLTIFASTRETFFPFDYLLFHKKQAPFVSI